MSEAQTILRSQIVRIGGLEFIGLFWIAAEVAILFFVLAARRHLEERPLPPAFALHPPERGRAWLWTAGFFLIAMAVLCRHLLSACSAVQPQDALLVFIRRARTHLAVWSGFVAVWVGLEVVIVYHGWRGYRALEALLGRRPAKLGSARAGHIAGVVLVAGLMFHAAAYAQTAVQIMQAARGANQVYYNALYLYLRLAGVVWILAEWVAAVVLWKSYRLIAGVARHREAADA